MLLLYYQLHILQWKQIGKGCQIIYFSFNFLYLDYSMLGIKDRNRTLHDKLTPLSYVPYVEKGRTPRYFPTAKPNTIICITINTSALFFCLPLIICLDKNIMHLQNCCVFVEAKQVIFNMIHQQHDNFHVCHIIYWPLKAPVIPFFCHEFFGEYDEQDEKGESSVISLLLFSCCHHFLVFHVSATTDQIPSILSLSNIYSLIT